MVMVKKNQKKKKLDKSIMPSYKIQIKYNPEVFIRELYIKIGLRDWDV